MPRFDHLELDSPQEDSPDRKPVQLDTIDEKHWLKMADENRRQGLYDNALRFYSRALELDKSLVVAWLGQVQMLVAQGEYPEAEMWSRKGLELFRNNGDLMAARAQALCRMGDTKPAHPLCDASLTQEGLTAYRWMVRGELMIAGRSEVDRHCFDKAGQIDSDWLVPLEVALIYLHYRLPAKALQRARLAVEKASDNYFCWYVQARCELVQNLLRQGRQSLLRCLELQPKHAEATRLLVNLDNRGWSLGRGLRRLFGGS